MKALADPDERKRLAEGAASPEAGMLRGLANWQTMTVVETFAPENEGLAGRTVRRHRARARPGAVRRARRHRRSLDELRTVHPATARRQRRRELAAAPRRVARPASRRRRVRRRRAPRHAVDVQLLDRDAPRRSASTSLMPLEEAVHLLTDRQARLYGLRERGRIAEGWHADLVVLRPRHDRARPRRRGATTSRPAPAASTPRPRASPTSSSTASRSCTAPSSPATPPAPSSAQAEIQRQ